MRNGTSSQFRVPRAKWLRNFNERPVGGGVYVIANRAGRWDIVSAEELEAANSVFAPAVLIDRLAGRHLVIVPENAVQIVEDWQRYNGRAFETGPSLLVVHLTQRCNLGCTYCHSSAIPLEAKGRDMPDEVVASTIEFIIKLAASRISISFQGGEPTLMLDLIGRFCSELPKRAPEKEFKFSITTNGTNFSAATLAALRRYGVGVSVSIDGDQLSHDTHRKHRDGRGSFHDALAGIEELKADSPKLFGGRIMVVTEQTRSRCVEIINSYVERGQYSFHFKPATKLGTAKSKWGDIGIEFEDYWGTYETILNHIIYLNGSGVYCSESYLGSKLNQPLENRRAH